MANNYGAGVESIPKTTLQQTKYEGDIQASISKRHPLHDALEPSGVVRFQPQMDDDVEGTILKFNIVFGDRIDTSEPQARRTKYLKSNDQHILVWPRDLARAVGLPKHTDGMEIMTCMSPPDGRTFSVRFDPNLSIPHLEEGGYLKNIEESTRKSLQPIYGSQNGKLPEKYRLRFPVKYNDVYDFVEGTSVGVSVAEYREKLVTVLTPHTEDGVASLTRPLQYGQTSAESSAGNVTTTDQFGLYVPKILVRTIFNGEQTIHLHPKPSGIILEPGR